MSEEITNVEGESVNKLYVTLSMWMIENKINTIEISYSGSGDSGDYIMETKDIPEKIIETAYQILDSIVNPNFNNSGSHGSAVFLIEEGMLRFQCAHSDIIETTDDTSYDKDLLDTSML